ncbi:hypothetical protein HRI_004212400 [Hibiscus trionum]|uniref:Uncharacterized protein n=1 Tax=Hibiscus trionum TaxID=183268 RepID=A0A9W7J2F0_HIBTR|nr:hypothetical protein HRI_004212400 [Hibiscus trionum]
MDTILMYTRVKLSTKGFKTEPHNKKLSSHHQIRTAQPDRPNGPHHHQNTNKLKAYPAVTDACSLFLHLLRSVPVPFILCPSVLPFFSHFTKTRFSLFCRNSSNCTVEKRVRGGIF